MQLTWLIIMSYLIISMKAWLIPYQKHIKLFGSLGEKSSTKGSLSCEDSANCKLDISLEGRLKLSSGHSIKFEYEDIQGLIKQGKIYIKESSTILSMGPEIVMPAYHIAHKVSFSSVKDDNFGDWTTDLFDDNKLFESLNIGSHRMAPIDVSNQKTFTTIIEEKKFDDVSDKFKCGSFLKDDINVKQIYSIIPIRDTGHIQFTSNANSVLNITLCVDLGVEQCENFKFVSNEDIIFESSKFSILLKRSARPKRPQIPTLVSQYNGNDKNIELTDWRTTANSYRGETLKGTLGAVQSTCLYGHGACKPGVYDMTADFDWSMNTWRQCSEPNNTEVAESKKGPIALIIGVSFLVVGIIGAGIGIAKGESDCRHCGFIQTGIAGPTYQYDLASRLRDADDLFLDVRKEFPSKLPIIEKDNLVYPSNIFVKFYDFEDSYIDINFQASDLKFKFVKPKGKIEKYSIPICNINLGGGISSCKLSIQYDGSDQELALWTDKQYTIVITPSIKISHGKQEIWVGTQNIYEGSWKPEICIGLRIDKTCATAEDIKIITGPDINTLLPERDISDKQSDKSWDFVGFWNFLDSWWKKLIAILIWALSIFLAITFLIVTIKVFRMWNFCCLFHICFAAIRTDCPNEFYFKQGDSDNFTNVSIRFSSELLDLDEVKPWKDFVKIYFHETKNVKMCVFKDINPCHRNMQYLAGHKSKMCDNRIHLTGNEYKFKIVTKDLGRGDLKKFEYKDCFIGKPKSIQLPHTTPIFAPKKGEILYKGLPSHWWKSTRLDPQTKSYDENRYGWVDWETWSELENTYCKYLMVPVIMEDFKEENGDRYSYKDPTFSIAPMCLEEVMLEDIAIIEERNGCTKKSTLCDPTIGITVSDMISNITNWYGIYDLYGMDCYTVPWDVLDYRIDRLGKTFQKESLLIDYINIANGERLSRIMMSTKGFIISEIKVPNVGREIIEDKDDKSKIYQTVEPLFALPTKNSKTHPMTFVFLSTISSQKMDIIEEDDGRWLRRVDRIFSADCAHNAKYKVEHGMNTTTITYMGNDCVYKPLKSDNFIKIQSSPYVELNTCIIDGVEGVFSASSNGPIASSCICDKENSVICSGTNHFARFQSKCEPRTLKGWVKIHKYSGSYNCGEQLKLDFNQDDGTIKSLSNSLISYGSSDDLHILKKNERIKKFGRIRDMHNGEFYYIEPKLQKCKNDYFLCLWNEHKNIVLLSIIMPAALVFFLIIVCLIKVCLKARVKRGLSMGYNAMTNAADSIITLAGARPSNAPAGFKYKSR